MVVANWAAFFLTNAACQKCVSPREIPARYPRLVGITRVFSFFSWSTFCVLFQIHFAAMLDDYSYKLSKASTRIRFDPKCVIARVSE